MNGKDAIISKIIADAELKANEIISNAQQNRTEKISAINKEVDKFLRSEETALKEDCLKIVERKETVAKLDVRKLLLKRRQDLITETFELVYKNLLNLDKKSYLNLVEKLITDSADLNDKVVLSKDGVLSVDDVNSLQIVKDKKLVAQNSFGDFIGGVMLIGQKCDKDLTFKAYVNYKREELASSVNDKLFRV